MERNTSSYNLLLKLFTSKRFTEEALNSLINNKTNLDKSYFTSEEERLQRTILAITAHIEDAKILLSLERPAAS